MSVDTVREHYQIGNSVRELWVKYKFTNTSACEASEADHKYQQFIEVDGATVHSFSSGVGPVTPVTSFEVTTGDSVAVKTVYPMKVGDYDFWVKKTLSGSSTSGSWTAYSGWTIKLHRRFWSKTEWNDNGTGTYYNSFKDATKSFEQIPKRTSVVAVTMDSRKEYGQPNEDGTFDLDPNASRRNINFNGWKFKGGLFIGWMQPRPTTGGAGTNINSRDKSGASRFQLYRTTASDWSASSLKGSSINVFYLGRPTASGADTNELNMKSYQVGPGDANYNVASADVRWSNRWIQSDAETPVGTATLAQQGSANPDVTATLYPLSFYAFPDFVKVAVRLQNEVALENATDLSNLSSSHGWAYFANIDFESDMVTNGHTEFNNIAPRLWTVGSMSAPSTVNYAARSKHWPLVGGQDDPNFGPSPTPAVLEVADLFSGDYMAQSAFDHTNIPHKIWTGSQLVDHTSSQQEKVRHGIP